jgi:hypothetical protein
MFFVTLGLPLAAISSSEGRIPADWRRTTMKGFKLAILVVSVLFTAALSARAEEKKMEAPKPGPEVKKLGYFVGAWKSEGEIKQNPFMPAGKMTGTSKCEWFPGAFHVVCHDEGKGPTGPVHGLGILAYNTEDKAYTYSGIDSSGFSTMAKGSVDGNTWTYTSEEKMGGKTYLGRYSMVTSPDSYTFKYESSDDGKNWMAIMEGTTTKVAKKAAPAAEKK